MTVRDGRRAPAAVRPTHTKEADRVNGSGARRRDIAGDWQIVAPIPGGTRIDGALADLVTYIAADDNDLSRGMHRDDHVNVASGLVGGRAVDYPITNARALVEQPVVLA